MAAGLDWNSDGKDWPNREASRFVEAGGQTFHAQVAGEGPAILLLHGTGASTHSWRHVLPMLAKTHRVIAPDLPGHGFSRDPPPKNLTLPGMAAAIGALLDTLEAKPRIAAGHSAGAVVLVRMAVEGLIAPETIVSFNGAFFPFAGVAQQLFSPLAKAAAATSFMPKLFASMADRAAVERLLGNTGSKVDAQGFDLYQRLFRNQGHVASTLRMMASWDLSSVESDLRRLAAEIYFVKALGDRTIAPATADRAAALARNARVIAVANLGHLMHEEDPERAAALILDPLGRR